MLDDFSEFYSHILWHLHEISKKADVGFACILIRTLSKIIYNNVSVLETKERPFFQVTHSSMCTATTKKLLHALHRKSRV